MDALGRYGLQEKVGSGAMGAVYCAHDSLLSRTVAIKVIQLSGEAGSKSHEESRVRLLWETKTAARLSHPNIISIYDFGEEAGTAYIVMELVQGRNLQSLLDDADGPLPIDTTLRILDGAAAALDYAHSEGVVHRDVKPSNIMVLADGRVKLADFGIAKITGGTTLTRTGLVLGTPYFMAPEQVMAETMSGRMDQYALAAVAYTALTGHKLFSAQSFPTLVAQILNETPLKPSDHNPQLNHRVDEALMKGLVKKPEDRYATCGLLVEALKAAHTSPPPPPQSEKTGNRRRVLLLGAALAVLAAISISLVIYFNRPPQTELQSSELSLQEGLPGAGSTSGETAQPEDLLSTESATAVAESSESDPSSSSEVSQRSAAAPAWPTGSYARDGLRYPSLPAGVMEMGCVSGDSLCAKDEQPRHTVEISKPFWITRTEIPVSAFRRFAAATMLELPDAPSSNPSWERGDLPMVNVTWQEAAGYCAWVGGRLPTEAEWEYASRAGKDEIRPADLDATAWYTATSGEAHHAVGTKAANSWGVHDMLGGVWEWCADWYDFNYYRESVGIDPPGPETGTARVVRGGAWNSGERYLRHSERYSNDPRKGNSVIGFRCVLESAP